MRSSAIRISNSSSGSMTNWLVENAHSYKAWLRHERRVFPGRYSFARQRSEKLGQYIVTEKLSENSCFVFCVARPKFYLSGDRANPLEWMPGMEAAFSQESDSHDSEIASEYDKPAAASMIAATQAATAAAVGAGNLKLDDVSERRHLPIYTLEVARKAHLVEKCRRSGVNLIGNLLEAKRLQTALRCPFICRLIDSFKDHCNLYFVKPDSRAGNLRQHIAMRVRLMVEAAGGSQFSMPRSAKEFGESGVNIGSCFSASEIRFVSAQLVLALEYLENLRIAHRDIRSENVQFDYNGYVCLTDLSCAKRLQDGRAYSLVGCPDVMAPEMLHCLLRISSNESMEGCTRFHPYSGYSNSVDYWALGQLMFEMATGQPMYNIGQSRAGLIRYSQELKRRAIKLGKAERQLMQLQQQQQQQKNSRTTGDRQLQHLTEVISGLTNVQPGQRLGCGRAGVNELRNHIFFLNICFYSLFNRSCQPEYRPSREISIYQETEVHYEDIGCDQFDQFSEEFDQF